MVRQLTTTSSDFTTTMHERSVIGIFLTTYYCYRSLVVFLERFLFHSFTAWNKHAVHAIAVP